MTVEISVFEDRTLVLFATVSGHSLPFTFYIKCFTTILKHILPSKHMQLGSDEPNCFNPQRIKSSVLQFLSFFFRLLILR